MSTHIHEYLVYGIKLVYDEAFADQYEQHDQYHDSPEGLLMLVDGMNGEYILIGKQLAMSEDDDPLGQGDPVLIPVPDPAEALRIAKQIRNVFGIQQPLGLHFVAHYH